MALQLRHLCSPSSLCQMGPRPLITALLGIILQRPLDIFLQTPPSFPRAGPGVSRRRSSSTTTMKFHLLLCSHLLPWVELSALPLVSLLLGFLVFPVRLFLFTSLGLRKPQIPLQWTPRHQQWRTGLWTRSPFCRLERSVWWCRDEHQWCVLLRDGFKSITMMSLSPTFSPSQWNRWTSTSSETLCQTSWMCTWESLPLLCSPILTVRLMSVFCSPVP